MKVRLLERCSAGAAGKVVDLPKEDAENLIMHCSAEVIKSKPGKTDAKSNTDAEGSK